MAKTKKKQDSEVQQTPAQSPEQAPEQTTAPEETKEQKPDPPKESRLLINILTILLVLVGVCEVALLAYVGFQAFRGSLARERDETQQAAAAQDGSQRAAGSHYLGPGLQVENGVVVWRREDSPLGGAGSGTTYSQTGAGGETRLASIGVPQINYWLAEDDER